MAIKVSFPYMIKGTVCHPVPLVVGDEDFILRTDPNAAGGTESGSERLEVALAVRAVDPAAPGGIVGHIATTFAKGLAIGHGKLPTGSEVEGSIFAPEGVHHRAEMIFMILPGYAELIGHGFIAVAHAILVGIDQTGEFRFLSDIVCIFFWIVEDTIGLH